MRFPNHSLLRSALDSDWHPTSMTLSILQLFELAQVR
jgi:hypothetical protein